MLVFQSFLYLYVLFLGGGVSLFLMPLTHLCVSEWAAQYNYKEVKREV